jgi:hypothetical protein
MRKQQAKTQGQKIIFNPNWNILMHHRLNRK